MSAIFYLQGGLEYPKGKVAAEESSELREDLRGLFEVTQVII